MSAYREHRIRTSLDGRLGRSPDSADEVRAMARDVYRKSRGVYFSREQLDAMPWQERELIEAQARRLYGKRNG